MPEVIRRIESVDEGFAYIESFTNFERTDSQPVRAYRLDRMRALLDLFGHPERDFRSIHLAGSKGKGSTALFVASILKAAGIKTGLYASPHVATYRERITLSGAFFDDDAYVDGINRILARIASLGADALAGRGEATTFELLTLLAFIMFREAGCKWAVIETGIGGRLDATNVITPVACLLTPVELEHTDLLGTTLPQIATEKAGIIKDSVPAFSGYQHPEVRAVFAATGALRRAPIRFLADEVESIDVALGLEASRAAVTWREAAGRPGTDAFLLAMPGEVQAENAALALLAARTLFGGQGAEDRPDDWPRLTEAALAEGLAFARLPGRMEVIERPGGTIVLDVAHTPVSVSRLLSSYRKLFPSPSILLFGSVTGKNHEGMADVLAPAFDRIIISTPGTFKKSDPRALAEIFHGRNPATRLVEDPGEALAEAERLSRASGGARGLPILVTGSFYMVAEIRRLVV